jgi:hypothetical protein
MDKKLSPDLWFSIASWLQVEELSRLGSSSRHLLQLLRPILYENTILRDKHFEFSTILLLSRDPVLAGAVKRFRYTQKIFGMVDALLNMTALTKLAIGISFEDNEAGQKSLVNFFKTREQPLEELAMYGTTFASDNFDIPGLKSIEWHISASELLNATLSIHSKTDHGPH